MTRIHTLIRNVDLIYIPIHQLVSRVDVRSNQIFKQREVISKLHMNFVRSLSSYSRPLVIYSGLESQVRRLKNENPFKMSIQDMDWLIMVGSVFKVHNISIDNYEQSLDKLLLLKRQKVLLEKSFLKIIHPKKPIRTPD